MFCHHQKGGDCWPKGHYPGYFDDSKTYLVMYLIILILKYFRFKKQILTTPLKDSQFWSLPNICIPKLKHIGSFGICVEEKFKKKIKTCLRIQVFVLCLFSFQNILSKLNSRSRDMGYHTHTFSRVVYGFKIISISISKLSFS